MPTDPLPCLDAETLLKRAVAHARSAHARKGQRHLRRTAVMELFCIGSGFAEQLCAWAGVDPFYEVKR